MENMLNEIPFINLSSGEEDLDLARQSVGQARDSEFEEDLQKVVALSLADQEGESKRKGKGKGNVPMEVQGKGESKDAIDVDDDDSSDDAGMYFKQLLIDWEINVLADVLDVLVGFKLC